MKLKKLTAIFLALVLVLGLSTAAMAASTADTNGSITITDNANGASVAGKTFSAYRLFDMTAADTGADPSYDVYASYAFSAGWVADFFDETRGDTDLAAALADLSALTSDSAAMQEFGNQVAKYISDHSIAAINSATAASDGEEVTITSLPIGYYIVVDASATDSTTVSACMINFTQPDTTIKIKADNVPPFTKNSNGAAEVYAEVGKAVPFTLKSKMPDIAYYRQYAMTFSDSMSSGLTFNPDSLTIQLGSADYVYHDGSFYASSDTGYGSAIGDIAYTAGSNGFEIAITLKAAGSNSAIYAKDAAIQIDYTATVNSSAAAGTADKNEATLQYTNDPSGGTATTPSKHVDVYTVQIDLTKTDGTNPITTDFATFALYGPTNKGISVPDGVDSTKVVDAATYYYYGEYSTSTTNGQVAIPGLADGTYYLREVKAPDGYNLLADDTKIVITAGTTGNITYAIDSRDSVSNSTVGHVDLTVANSEGIQLPSTGGMGTRLFTGIGLVLMIAAGVYLIINRKKVFGK